MRSRKPSPGLAVTWMTSQSDRMRVPPVTALRSPPDSRITGADSPVTADSSTEAIPSITSPSAGIMSPASTRYMSPWRSWVEGVRMKFVGCVPFGDTACSFLALVSWRVLRSASAWALPRPSASASEKLANSTVNHSQSATAPIKPVGASPFPDSAWIHRPGGQHAADLDHEHDRVAHLIARVELAKRVEHRALVQLTPKRRLLANWI